MSITKKVLLLTLFQGLVCQRWEFPTEIVGLVGSCVEIPCKFYPRERSTTSSTVWYLERLSGYHQIFNSRKSSSASTDYRDRTSLVPGNNSCSLRIDPVRRDDGGDEYYPGIAEDEDTNAWKQEKMTLGLRVTDTPNIPELTRNGEMVEGRPEKVSCSVVHTCGSNPPSLRLNKAGQTERRSVDLSGGNWREIITIRYIPSHEDGEIQCTATYHNGQTSQMAAPLIIRYAPKDVTVNLPKNKEFLEGSDVTLTCSCRSNPPPHTYEWYRGNNKINLRPEVQRIVVRNLNKDTEPYSCVAINTVGRGESPPTPIPVKYAPKDVTVSLPKNEKFLEGSDVILTCSSRSNPPPHRYEWYRGNSKINLRLEVQSIKVQNVNKDTHPYSCVAINTVGRGESPLTPIPVQYAPKDVMVSFSKNEELLEGSDVILTCSSRSNPPPHRYEWYRGNSKIKLNSQEQNLRVQNISKDTERFSCVAINIRGRGESPPIEMPVPYAVTGVQVVVLHPTEGATELKCNFVRSNPSVTHYTWMKDGKILLNKTEQILVLDNSEDKSGMYSCIAHSTAGSSTSAELEFKDSYTNEDSTGNWKYSFILILILGILAGVLFLIVIVHFVTRTKASQTSSRSENSQQPDAPYTDLVKTEVSSDYDTIKTSFPLQPATERRVVPSDHHYENIERK
ncbi:B-cell receptor CD22-like isoform X2 [Aquarana catesbeiana]|uniref:B-cell receptor CD22-like isoform X2 n=1 Tax=Aquarana catesbeiana TaxID=8400 RepID=UPI003CC9C3C1